MRNRLPFAALTAAFTVAGSCIGYACESDISAIAITFVVAIVGGVAAALSGSDV